MYPVFFSFVAALALGASAAAQASVVRISSVNGSQVSPYHVETLDVRPGDLISLTADFFATDAYNNILNPEGLDARQFVWSSDSVSPQGGYDVCDPIQTYNCQAVSNFEFTGYGVNFRIPYNAQSNQSIVRVRERNGYGGEDLLILRLVIQQYPPNYPPTYPQPYPQQPYPNYPQPPVVVYPPRPPVVIVTPPVYMPPRHRPPVVVYPPSRPPQRPPVYVPGPGPRPGRPPVIIVSPPGGGGGRPGGYPGGGHHGGGGYPGGGGHHGGGHGGGHPGGGHGGGRGPR